MSEGHQHRKDLIMINISMTVNLTFTDWNDAKALMEYLDKREDIKDSVDIILAADYRTAGITDVRQID